jgi:DNA-binding NarL/FixJ family response regulator
MCDEGRVKPRIVLADSQQVVADALACLLEPEFDVAGRVIEGGRLVGEARRLRPDLVLTDVWQPGLDGLVVARRLRDEAPEVRVVFLTAQRDPAVAAQAFRVGAVGYVLRSASAADLRVALRAAMRGERWLSPLLAGGNLSALPKPAGRDAGAGRLSPRRREVVRLIAAGQSMKQAAAALGISTRTIAYHKYEAMRTLELASTAQLVRFAVETRLLPGS